MAIRPPLVIVLLSTNGTNPSAKTHSLLCFDIPYQTEIVLRHYITTLNPYHYPERSTTYRSTRFDPRSMIVSGRNSFLCGTMSRNHFFFSHSLSSLSRHLIFRWHQLFDILSFDKIHDLTNQPKSFRLRINIWNIIIIPFHSMFQLCTATRRNPHSPTKHISSICFISCFV